MPANPFSEGLSVRVSGDASDARAALGGLQNSLLSTRKLALGLGGVLAGALAVRGLATATRAAADFETAMVEVQKVTDAETAAALAGQMRELSKEIPVAQEELAGLAADAARFGIRGTENIEAFTESVAKMAIATDLTSQEAGQAFARLATLTDTPVDEIENLGSAINTLSNNFATSSSEIVDSMLRSSAALTQFGLTNTEITAMSAALNEVSESSQRAGSRLRRLGQELLDPRRVGDLAEALGMTEEEFRNIRREDPARLMMQIVRAFAEGGDTAEALRGSLTTTSRQAVAGLAQNLEGLEQALNQSSSSFEENTSLQREFDAATQTFNSRLQILRNNLNDIAITVGNQLLPVLNPLLATVNDLLAGGEGLSETLGEGTATDLRELGGAARTLVGPTGDVADELGELGINLAEIADGPAISSATRSLRELRFTLTGIASALNTINGLIDGLQSRWNNLPAPVRRGISEAVQFNPAGGAAGAVTRGAAGVQQGIQNGEFTIRIEGDTGVIRRVSAEAAEGVLTTRENRAIRTGAR